MKNLHRDFSLLRKMGSIYMDKHLVKYALNHDYSVYLMHICHSKGIRQDHLKDHLRVNRSTIKRAIDHLEDNGYITKEVYESDKRKYCLFPTDKALEIIDDISRLKQEWNNIITADLSQDQIDLVYKMNKIMLDAANAHIKMD